MAAVEEDTIPCPAGVDLSFVADLNPSSSDESESESESEVPEGHRVLSLKGLESRLGPALNHRGCYCSDAALSEDFASSLAADIELLFASELLKPSRNRLATARDPQTGAVTSGAILPKPGVHELDVVFEGELVAPAATSMCAALRCFVEDVAPSLGRRLGAACPELGIRGVDTVKLQLNEGEGGCFPVHYDTSSAHSSRGVTALIYLNPLWKEGDGGEVELLPFPLEPLQLAPLDRRLVCFCATQTLHRVLPSRARRLCLSTWFSCSDSASLLYPRSLPPLVAPSESSGGDGGEEAKQVRLLAKLLGSKEARRLLAKVFYRSEYQRSFIDAFGGGAEVRAALVLDDEQTDAVAARLGPGLVRAMERLLPLRAAEDGEKVAAADAVRTAD